MHAREMHLQPEEARACGLEAQQAGVDMLLQIQANGADVAADLLAPFLEHEGQASFPAPASRVEHVRGDGGLAGPGHARDEDAGAAEEAAGTQHGVEARDAG